ncbi:DUF2202 domain-containing protein [Demequina sp. NBRC 110054]|uniref:DUF2202 domain-containing protein n=1 Tax=Demequina sp. NBRC 110054 TaxID=1570343 RepID=UPI0009FBCDEE|nr:DUF2202 domain-containing protein [Demequina sp. NBRC 110054]
MDRKILAAAIVGGTSLVLAPVAAWGAGYVANEAAQDDAAVADIGARGNGYGLADADDAGSGTTARDRDGDCDDMMRGGTGSSGSRSNGSRGGGMMAGGMTGGGYGDGSAVLDLVDDDISDADAEALAYMVEEEKLAHDLYVALGEEWDLRVFAMISRAETQHTEAVRSVLDAYDLTDPTDGMDEGEFVDADLQELYDTLLAQGLESEEDALTVGALVEETDIADLQDRATDEESVSLLFERLESASEHHLVAFVRNLDAAGAGYEAQVLSDDELATILGE